MLFWEVAWSQKTDLFGKDVRRKILEVRLISSGESRIWDQSPKNMEWEFENVHFNWRNLKNWKLFLFSIKGILPTRPHSDSHPCISPTGSSYSGFIMLRKYFLQSVYGSRARWLNKWLIQLKKMNHRVKENEISGWKYLGYTDPLVGTHRYVWDVVEMLWEFRLFRSARCLNFR